jgi:hypothetical protein
MKAIRLHEPVGIDGLKYEDAPEPSHKVKGKVILQP